MLLRANTVTSRLANYGDFKISTEMMVAFLESIKFQNESFFDSSKVPEDMKAQFLLEMIVAFETELKAGRAIHDRNLPELTDKLIKTCIESDAIVLKQQNANTLASGSYKSIQNEFKIFKKTSVANFKFNDSLADIPVLSKPSSGNSV